jgi:hypothetical protein
MGFQPSVSDDLQFDDTNPRLAPIVPDANTNGKERSWTLSTGFPNVPVHRDVVGEVLGERWTENEGSLGAVRYTGNGYAAGTFGLDIRG